MNKEALKAELERKTYEVFERRGGSLAVQAFTAAKQACLDAGIPEGEVQQVVYAATDGAKRK
jgi:hypothetical protein